VRAHLIKAQVRTTMGWPLWQTCIMNQCVGLGSTLSLTYSWAAWATECEGSKKGVWGIGLATLSP
jgi:hypothetical protein